MKWKLLEGVPEADVQRLLSIARRRRFGRGEGVFHQDDPADTLHLIDKGRFAVRVATRLGDTAILSVLGPGEMFGELALLDEGEARRSATVAALEGGETLSVHRLDFDRLTGEHPGTTQVLIAILSAQVRRLSAHLLDALYVPADRRVLRRLVEVAGVYGEGAAEGAVVPLTQEDLADLAGTSRATVNRVLREEDTRGTVKLGRGRTTVLDAAALARRAGLPVAP
jgi:CRP/FNR family transcriptional regulator, cyclic AMP receptor protein